MNILVLLRHRAVLALLPLAVAGSPLAQPVDSIAADPVAVDAQFPPQLRSVTIKSGESLLNGRALLAQGKGPHRSVLLLHGLPGNELNMDLAQAARRSGWNVFMFHYRGTWGSGGEFSMSNVLEDTAAALSHVRGLGPDANWRVDAKRIVLVGHSLGGFAALVTGASDADVRGIVSISGADMGRVGSGLAASQNSKEFWTRFFKSANAVNVSNIDALLEQWSASADNWQFEKLPQRLGKRSVLLVVATKDTVTVPATHHTPLASALKTSMGAAFTEVSLDTDHSYSDRRIALTRAVIGWLEANK